MSNNISNNEHLKAKLKVTYSEMMEIDETFVIETAMTAMISQEKSEKVLYHKDIAQMIKQELDTHRGGTWNVIVGQAFGSYITHETKTLLHFYIGNIAFMVWRHG